MNSKRQTVWLVSMLSLMVVLSAYYLFTDDVNNMQVGSDNVKTQELKLDATAVTGKGQTTGAASGAQGSSTGAAKLDQASSAAAQKKTDDQVLQQVSAKALKGDDYFIDLQIRKTQEMAKLSEQLMSVVTNSKQNTEAVTKAYEDMFKLEQHQVKMTSLEDKLNANYRNSVVVQDGAKWKVIVQADKLQKSEAVSIIDMAMKELGVGADKLSVEFKK